MKSFYKKRFLSIVFVFLLISTLFAKTVKVGYFTDAGNFLYNSESNSENNAKEGLKKGFGYEYLQIIASYAGWDYEYVYGTWDELYQQLLEERIDILPKVIISAKKDGVLFPNYSMGVQNYYIYSNKPESKFNQDDLAKLAGKRIALPKDVPQTWVFKKNLEKNNIECSFINYDYDNQYTELFENGEIDYLFGTDVSAEFHWTPVYRIGESDFYIGISKNRTDILSELNTALDEIFMVNPSFNYILWDKYYSGIVTSKSLTQKEKQWLENKKTITVGCLKKDLPFCSFNELTGNAEGLVVDLENCFKSIFNVKEIEFEYKFYNSLSSIQYAYNRKDIDVIFPYQRDFYLAETNNLFVTNGITELPVVYICNKNSHSDYMKNIAVVNYGREYNYVQKNYPNAKIVVYDTIEQCIKAVQSNEIDGVVYESYKLQNIRFDQKNNGKLKVVNLPSVESNACFGVSKENYQLISILNKLVANINQEEINSMLEKHTISFQKYSFKDFSAEYMKIIIFCLLLLFIFFCGFIFLIGKLQEYMDYDVLTHLLNRRKLDSYMSKLIKKANEQSDNFCILMFDIDDFKKINDTYGHACGDVILKHAATTISRNIKEEDLAFRWGGEEFLVIIKTNGEMVVKIAERIRKTIERQLIEYKDKKIKITVTIGVAEYKDNRTAKNLFELADENLYKGKRNGKNQVVF